MSDPERGHDPSSTDDRPPRLTTAFMLVFYMMMAGLGVVIARLFGVESVWRTEPGPIAPELGLLLGVALGLIVHGSATFLRRRFGWTQGFHDTMTKMLGRPDTTMVVVAAAASAVGEEVLFRGALLPVIGAIPQAIVFGLLHVGPGRAFRFWPFYAAAMGYGFGLLYQASGTLVAPVLAHFTINYFGLASLRDEPRRDSGE